MRVDSILSALDIPLQVHIKIVTDFDPCSHRRVFNDPKRTWCKVGTAPTILKTITIQSVVLPSCKKK